MIWKLFVAAIIIAVISFIEYERHPDCGKDVKWEPCIIINEVLNRYTSHTQ